MELLLVYATAPDMDTARAMAKHLVASRVVACVNILPATESIYRWQGEIQEAREVAMIMKATKAAWPRLMAELTARHPYSVPSLSAYAAAVALPAFAQWVSQECEV